MRSRSSQQERRFAKEAGGRAVPASGAFWSQKGDVRMADYLAELKFTDKASFSLKKSVWTKIYREALLSSRMPVMIIQVQDVELAVLAKEDFLGLLRATPQDHLGEGSVP